MIVTLVAVVNSAGDLESILKYREPMHRVIGRLDVFNRQLDQAQTAWDSQPCWEGWDE